MSVSCCLRFSGHFGLGMLVTGCSALTALMVRMSPTIAANARTPYSRHTSIVRTCLPSNHSPKPYLPRSTPTLDGHFRLPLLRQPAIGAWPVHAISTATLSSASERQQPEPIGKLHETPTRYMVGLSLRQARVRRRPSEIHSIGDRGACRGLAHQPRPCATASNVQED